MYQIDAPMYLMECGNVSMLKKIKNTRSYENNKSKSTESESPNFLVQWKVQTSGHI